MTPALVIVTPLAQAAYDHACFANRKARVAHRMRERYAEELLPEYLRFDLARERRATAEVVRHIRAGGIIVCEPPPFVYQWEQACGQDGRRA